MRRLIATIGLPRSGKSTWAREQGHPIVNQDAIRLALHGKPFIGLAEPFVRAIAHCMVRALFEAGHETVILDATNVTEKRRFEWVTDEWQTEWHVIETPKSVCLERAIGARREDLIGTAYRTLQPMNDFGHILTPLPSLPNPITDS